MVSPRRIVIRRAYGYRSDERRDRKHSLGGKVHSSARKSGLGGNSSKRGRVGSDWTPTGLGAAVGVGKLSSGDKGGGRGGGSNSDEDGMDFGGYSSAASASSYAGNHAQAAVAEPLKKGGGDSAEDQRRRATSGVRQKDRKKTHDRSARELNIDLYSSSPSEIEDKPDENDRGSVCGADESRDCGGKIESRPAPTRGSPAAPSSGRGPPRSASFESEDEGDSGDCLLSPVASVPSGRTRAPLPPLSKTKTKSKDSKERAGKSNKVKKAGKTSTAPRNFAGEGKPIAPTNYADADYQADIDVDIYDATKRRDLAQRRQQCRGGQPQVQKRPRRRRHKTVVKSRLPRAPGIDDFFGSRGDTHGSPAVQGGGDKSEGRSGVGATADQSEAHNVHEPKGVGKDDDIDEYTDTTDDEIVDIDSTAGEEHMSGEEEDSDGMGASKKKSGMKSTRHDKSGAPPISGPERSAVLDSPLDAGTVDDREREEGGAKECAGRRKNAVKGLALEHPIARAKLVDLTEKEREVDGDEWLDDEKVQNAARIFSGSVDSEETEDDAGRKLKAKGGQGKKVGGQVFDIDDDSSEDDEAGEQDDDEDYELSYVSDEGASSEVEKVSGTKNAGANESKSNDVTQRSILIGPDRALKKKEGSEEMKGKKEVIHGYVAEKAQKSPANESSLKADPANTWAPKKGRALEVGEPPKHPKSRQIFDLLTELGFVSKEFVQLSQEEANSLSMKTEYVMKVSGRFRSLSAIRSSLDMVSTDINGSFSERFEEAAASLGKTKVATIVGSCLYLVLSSAIGDLSDISVARRLPLLCDTLRLFASAETIPGIFHALSNGDLSTLPHTMAGALNPDVATVLLRFVSESATVGTSHNGADRSDLENCGVASLLAAACLHVINLKDVVNASGDVRKAIVEAAARVHLLPSYPLIELTLLFLLRLRRTALRMSSDPNSRQERFVRIIDSALFPPVRNKLLQLSTFLLSKRDWQGESVGSYSDWIRKCFTAAQDNAETLGVASFWCNGVYRPLSNGEIGTRIADIPWIDVCSTGITFFAIQQDARKSSCPDGVDELVDKLSLETVYAGRIAVHIAYSDIKKSRSENSNLGRPCVSFSMVDSAITLEISSNGWLKSNLPCLAPDNPIGRPSIASAASIGSCMVIKLQGDEAPKESQKLALQVFIKRDTFQDLLEALGREGVILLPSDDDDLLTTSRGGIGARERSPDEIQETTEKMNEKGTLHPHIELCTKKVLDMIAPSTRKESDAFLELHKGSRQSIASAVSSESVSERSDDESGIEQQCNGKRKRCNPGDHTAEAVPKCTTPSKNEDAVSVIKPPKRKRLADVEIDIGSAAKVTPLPFNRDKDVVIHASTSSHASPKSSPRIGVPSIARLRSNLSGLQSISALCFATRRGDEPLKAPSSSNLTNEEDIAEIIMSIDAALANVSDAMNTLAHLTGRIGSLGHVISTDVVDSLAWVHSTQTEVRDQMNSWLARREQVDAHLRKILVESLSK